MNLAEQAARRVELARAIGVEPRHWLVTGEAEVALIADTAPAAWGDGGSLLHGLPIKRGRPRPDWGLNLVLAPRP